MVATIEKPPIRQREFLRAREFAAIFGISERYAHELAQSGQIASVRFGRKSIRILASEVDRLKEEATRSK